MGRAFNHRRTTTPDTGEITNVIGSRAKEVLPIA